MKANLKNASGFTKLLYVHGEKIGMVAILACAGMLIWSALGIEQLGGNRKPEGLTQLTQKVSKTLTETRWGKFPKEDVLNADAYKIKTMEAVEREHFPPPQYGMNRPVLAPTGKRTDPVLLPAEELEVFSDAGLIASADPDKIRERQLQQAMDDIEKEKEKKERLEKAREEGRRNRGRDLLVDDPEPRPSGRRGPRRKAKEGAVVVSPRSGVQLSGLEEITATSWVVVLAKIPVELQHQHFEDALLSASGYQKRRDTPYYFGYRVQRALVTAQGQQPWKNLPSVFEKKLISQYKQYPFKPAPVVDKKYNHPLLTQRLLPLLLYQWDQRVSHSSMPLFSPFDPRTLKQPEEDDPSESKTEDGEFSDFENLELRGRSRDPGFREFGAEKERMQFHQNVGERPRENGGGFGNRFQGASLGRGSGEQIVPFVWNARTSHVLLRYFDRNVQPGYKYRYRIQLVLSDVNYCDPNNSTEIKEQYLDKTVIERKQGKETRFRLTEWSEPSPIASVPLPGRVYLVSSEPPPKESKFNDASEAELLIKVLNSEYSAEIAKSEKFARGSIINLRSKAEVVVASDFKPASEPEFDFHTGLTLIDFSGGEPLSRKNKQLIAPTRAILMDSAGQLMLQTELEDYEPVAEFKQRLEGKQDNRRMDFPEGGGDFGIEVDDP